MKVINYGSLNYDYVYTVNHIVTAGETLSSSNMQTFCGGKGLNQSIALAKANVSVYQAGLVGEDGQQLLNICKKDGVNTDFIQSVPGKSGHTIIQLDKKGQNSIILCGGSNRKQEKEYIDSVLEHFEKGDILLTQNEVNLVDYIIDQAYEKGMFIALNPSPYDEQLDTVDMSKVSLFFINEIEGEQITGKKEPQEMLDTIKMRYPNAEVVLTLGSEGSIYQDKYQCIKQPVFSVEVIDTTAAGDTFTGYFISSIIEKLPVEEGMKLAAKASSIAVSRAGATDSIPRREEVIL